MAYNFDKEFEIRDLRNGDWYWVNQAVLQDSRLTPSDNKVYAGMACFVNQSKNEQIVFPSVNAIADKVNLSPRQVRYSQNRLTKFGYIGKVNVGGGRGNKTTYALLKVANSAHFKETVQNLQQTVQTTTLNSANRMPKISSINKSNNKSNNKRESNSLTFLENLPEVQVIEITAKYNCTDVQLRDKADTLRNYCLAHGKRYKDYRAFLLNAVKKDFGLRIINASGSPDVDWENLLVEN